MLSFFAHLVTLCRTWARIRHRVSTATAHNAHNAQVFVARFPPKGADWARRRIKQWLLFSNFSTTAIWRLRFSTDFGALNRRSAARISQVYETSQRTFDSLRVRLWSQEGLEAFQFHQIGRRVQKVRKIQGKNQLTLTKFCSRLEGVAFSRQPKMACRKTARRAGTKKRAQRATSNVFAMFDQDQIQEFKEAFNMIDQNRDGFIDHDDLKDMLASLGKVSLFLFFYFQRI